MFLQYHLSWRNSYYFLWSDNEEIRLGNETDDIIKRLINSFLNNYQKEEIILRNGSNFVFECVGLLFYHIHKTSLKRSSYIKSPEWIWNKKAAINPKIEDDYCFEYPIVIALHHKEIKNYPEKISRIHHHFSWDYNWDDIEFTAGIKDWKRFEKNNKTIALNILFTPHNEKTITLAYKSKYNRKRKNKVVLLMITDGKKSIILL